MNGPSLIAIDVGNTRCQIGLFLAGELELSERFENTDAATVVDRVTGLWPRVASQPSAAIAMASANDPIAERLTSMIEDQLSVDVYVVGRDLPIPIGRQLDPETITGTDRLLNAAAAYDQLKQACIIVDAGTAVTVDFVDGEGTFHGGAIAPGANMQLRALHHETDALPELEFSAPAAEPIGRSTGQAMLQGVYYGISGLVRQLSERYAEYYGAYPTIIATGGDAAILFENDDLIDRIVPDLTLMGIATAARHALMTGVDGGSPPQAS